MKQIVIVLFLAAALAGPAAGELLRIEGTVDAMGAPYSVVLYGEDRDKLEEAVEQAFEEVRRLDRLLSNYRADSEWSRVNRAAAERPVEISPELFDLLARCVEYSRLSDGAFDITVGPLMKVWGFYKGSGKLPKRAEVGEALRRVGYRNLLLDRAGGTVRFARPGVEIDPGGIGKGYAVDRVAGVLRGLGIGTALISAGGSSILAMGAPPGEAGWKVDIRDPKNESKVVAEVLLKDESMGTSGSYEKFFIADGKMYAHIMDPRTGFPVRGMLAVSVIAPRALDSEAWTKPFFINGRSWAAAHKPEGFRVMMCPDPAEGSAPGAPPSELKVGPTCAWLQ